MSDFAGLWRLDGRPVDDHDVSRLARGLDARGIGPARVWREGSFALVHRQHVFTPEDERERLPLAGPSGGVLVADVRLDFRSELAAALGFAGEEAARPDGALVLAALERWGEAGVSRLYGDFALAFWQPGERRLVLARDPLRDRSLFVHRGAALIAFATRMRPLLALPDIPRDIDENAVADRLILNTDDPEQTLYPAIRRVPQGHVFTVTAEHTAKRRWWTMPEPGGLRFPGHEATVAAAEAVIDRALASGVRAVGPVGTCLTGGMDSATVTLFARRHLPPERLIALTRVPGGPTAPDDASHYHDESPRAGAFAAGQAGLNWHAVGDDGLDWGEADRRRWFLETGVVADNRINSAWFLPLARFMAARGGRVILTGGGGNFFYSYDGGLVELALLRQGRIGALLRLLAGRARNYRPGLVALVKSRMLAPCEPRRLRAWRKGWDAPWSHLAALNPTFAAETKLLERLDPSRYRSRSGPPRPSAHATRLWFHGDETIGDWSVAYRALTGIEWRAPLAGREVIEFFAALPQEAFVRDGRGRAIARSILAGHRPEEIVRDRRSGRQLGDWFAILTAERPRMLAALERLEASRSAGRVVDLARLERLLNDWPADAAAAEARRAEYHFVLTRGLETAEFLAWHDRSNT